MNHYHIKRGDKIITVWVPDSVYIGSISFCPCNPPKKDLR